MKTMKNRNNNTTTEVEVSDMENNEFVDMQAPSGSSVQSDDVKGYWDFEKSAIRFTPIAARMFDSSIEKSKISILIVGKLTQDCPLQVKVDENNDEPVIQGNKGDLVGVWYKPGLRVLLRKAGVDCYVKKVGSKDIGKPSPMHVFEIRSADGGNKLPLQSDTRSQSKDAASPFDAPTTKGGNGESALSDDNVPF